MNAIVRILAIIITNLYIIGTLLDDKDNNKTIGYYLKSGAIAIAIYNSFYIVGMLLNE